MANVQFFVVVVVVLALLSVPSATTASGSFNILSVPSHSHDDSKPAQEHGITPGSVERAPAPAVDYKFDYFNLVMQWAPTHCQDLDCKMTPLPAFFYIHGLWPQKNNGDRLEFCSTDQYVRITDKELLESMNAKWPNVVSGANYNPSIWRHQWMKHGTCSLTMYDQTAYFKKALELHSRYDVIAGIRKEMLPKEDGKYQISKLIQTLRKITGGKAPGISCLRDKSGNQSLHEVTFCFTREGVIMDCLKQSISSKCDHGKPFYFPDGFPSPAPAPAPGPKGVTSVW